MKRMHIAFCLEQIYGHVIPTLGMTLELIRRGHRVSYPVTKDFAPAIKKCGANPVVIVPIENRAQYLDAMLRENDHLSYKLDQAESRRLLEEVRREKTVDSIAQLTAAYRDDMPDLVVHDDCMDTAGRDFASTRGIPRALHYPAYIDESVPIDYFLNDRLILVSSSEVFHRDMQKFDRRFCFVGFIPEGRKQIFAPWDFSRHNGERVILITITTGMLAQTGFCQTMIDVFRNQPRQIVLSIAGALDPYAAVDAARLAGISRNIHLNEHSANLEILEHASLFISQGGHGGTMEAAYCGVPQLHIPKTPFHNAVSERVEELGLGVSMPASEFSAEKLMSRMKFVMNDEAIRERIYTTQAQMRQWRGAERAGDAIEEYLSQHS